ncbi:MAG: tetratricopeptide repeat protein [Deltaproteobacteria bacterium]|nr:tetratricopeptide repeat protein [Deltaproteobacteria bacterium]
MSTEPLPTIAQRIADDIEAFDFDAAFAKLADPQGGGALGPVLSGLLRARVQVGLEQRRDAYDTLQQVRGLRELGVPERLEAQLATARVLRLGWWSTDVALDMALAAAEQATRTGRRTLAVEAHLEAAQLFARKRCRDLSQRQIDAAQQLQVDAALVHATRGELAISFDQRPAAKEAFEAALALAEGDGEVAARQGAARLGRLGLARLFTVLGEFDAAREQLLALGDRPPGDLAAHRVTWRLHAAQADWARSAQVLARMLAASPASDPARSLMLEHASALYRAGDLDGAQAAWTKIAASGGGDWAARTAAGLLDKLQAGNTRRTRLQAFPSVTQLRDHCGPASVELCMRFFGTTAEQVAVAREIKHPDGGTPVHKMRRYMDAAGFHTRRVEADLPRLQAILDAGIPVIIEEDYSTTRHVAVAIGYDDRRGILEVQDPMTHEVRETPYEELGKLREFSNHGALVAVPATRTDLIEALDRAGALECAYISTTDRAWAAHDDGSTPTPIAWSTRPSRCTSPTSWRGCCASSVRATATIANAARPTRTRWPRCSARSCGCGPTTSGRSSLGRVRDVQGRTGEALAAFERARDRDPDDPSNWCAIGDCKLALGDRAGAREAFEQALRRDPAHTRSNENLADMAFDAGDNSLAAVLNDCARELAPRNAFNWHVYARILARRDALDDAIASYARAIELRPESTGFAVEHARLLARRGRVDEAIANLETLREQRPDDTFVLMSLADLAFVHGRHDTSLAACARFAEVDPKSATPLAIGGAAKCAKGELEAGLADLRAALSRRPTYAWAHREIGRALLDARRFDEAIAACAAGLGFATGSGESMFRLGDALVCAGHGPDGAGYLRRAARSGALEQAQLDRVAAALHEVEGINPAHEFFNTLGHEQPREVAVARAHVGLLLERIWAPGAANAVLSRLSELAPRDAWVVADGANALMGASLADERRGEVLFRRGDRRRARPCGAAAMVRASPQRARSLRRGARGARALRCDARDHGRSRARVARPATRRRGRGGHRHLVRGPAARAPRATTPPARLPHRPRERPLGASTRAGDRVGERRRRARRRRSAGALGGVALRVSGRARSSRRGGTLRARAGRHGRGTRRARLHRARGRQARARGTAGRALSRQRPQRCLWPHRARAAGRLRRRPRACDRAVAAHEGRESLAHPQREPRAPGARRWRSGGRARARRGSGRRRSHLPRGAAPACAAAGARWRSRGCARRHRARPGVRPARAPRCRAGARRPARRAARRPRRGATLLRGLARPRTPERQRSCDPTGRCGRVGPLILDCCRNCVAPRCDPPAGEPGVPRCQRGTGRRTSDGVCRTQCARNHESPVRSRP